MFLGHVAVGLAGKRFAPRASLPTLMLAAFFVDLIWPVFLLLGWEKVRVDPGNTAVTPLDFVSYPWTHSLHMTVFWAGLVALVCRVLTRDTRRATWLGVAVASHWVLDWISHRPDLELWVGGPRVGLGLWNSVAGTMIVEWALFLTGLWLYLRVTRPRGGRGRLSLWSLVAFVSAVSFANLQPLPAGTSERTIALMALLLWLFLPWAGWIEATRRTVR